MFPYLKTFSGVRCNKFFLKYKPSKQVTPKSQPLLPALATGPADQLIELVVPATRAMTWPIGLAAPTTISTALATGLVTLVSRVVA